MEKDFGRLEEDATRCIGVVGIRANLYTVREAGTTGEDAVQQQRCKVSPIVLSAFEKQGLINNLQPWLFPDEILFQEVCFKLSIDAALMTQNLDLCTCWRVLCGQVPRHVLGQN